MSKPSYEEILDIKRKINISDIIRDYIPLVQRGKNYFGVCPFHDDHNPSMSVSDEKQMYKCFVCGEAGDVFNFVKEYEKIPYYEAVKKVASKVGININIDTTYKRRENNAFSKQYEIYDLSNKFYQNNLNTTLGKTARSYLKDRQITEDMIKHFQIGLSFNDNNLSKLLSNKGFDDDLLVKSGISIRRDNKIYDIYRNRIMFPLWDINGKTIGFSGRIYEGNDQSKYINTMETDIFKKGSLLYNYEYARESILKKDEVIIVEGFMDVIRLYSIGINNVLASMGTAITNEQINLIRKLTKNVILMFDGDEAGGKATNSFIDVSKNVDFDIKIIRLEENLDPDDYILKKGKDKMLDHLSHAKSLFDYKMISTKKNLDMNNSEDVSKFINQIVNDLSKIDDDIVFDLELKKIIKLTGVSEELIKSKIKRDKKKEIKIEKPIKRNIKKSKYDKASNLILYNMINNNEMILYYYDNLSYLPNELDRKLASEIVLFYKKYNSFNLLDFITYLEDNNELVKRVSELDELNISKKSTKEEIDEYFETIKEYSKKKQIKELSEKLKNETNEVVRKELAKKIFDIRIKENK
ncbi:MAG: DNA primase [Bacilli bacterium]|nr:DNA primase [Bacilli bacterium]